MTPAASTSLTPLSEAEIHTIHQLYRSFSAGNAHLLKEAVAPDWQDIPLGPGQGPGPEGFKPVMEAMMQAFPDMEIVVHEIMGSAGRAAVRSEIRGTHRGELFGIPATNKPVRIALHEFHYLANGRVTHTWHLEDWFGMFHQIGALPPGL